MHVRIDHVGIATFDLDALRDLWCAAGFTVTTAKPLLRRDSSGTSTSLRQRSCHAIFGSTYLELTEVDREASDHHLAPWLRDGIGMHILAFGCDELEAVHAQGVRDGLVPSAIARATRFIDYGERHGDARFDWFMLPPSTTPEGLVCVVRNATPELVFQPDVQTHANGAADIREVVVAARNWERTCDRYATLLQTQPISSQEEARFVLPGAVLTVMSSRAVQARYPMWAGARSPDALAVLKIAAPGGTPRQLPMFLADTGPVLIFEPY